MHISADSNGNIVIGYDNRSEERDLEALRKGLMDRSVRAQIAENKIFFANGKKVYSVRMDKSDFSRSIIEDRLSKIPNGIKTTTQKKGKITIAF